MLEDLNILLVGNESLGARLDGLMFSSEMQCNVITTTNEGELKKPMGRRLAITVPTRK